MGGQTGGTLLEQSGKPESKTRPADHGLTRAQVDAKLNRLVFRSRIALLVETIWRASLPPLVVLGFFIGLSWIGLWLYLPFWARLIGIAGFAALFIWSCRDLLAVKWPSREAALHRIERDSGQSHRPLTAIEDDLSSGENNPETAALWALHKKRMMRALAAMRTRLPDPRAYRRDPYALRVVALILVVIGFASTGGQRWERLGSAFRSPIDLEEIASRLDAWVTPPLYTSEPPVYLTGDSAALRDPGSAIGIPEGSVLVVRSQGETGLSMRFVSDISGEAPIPVEPEAENGDPESGLPVERRLTLADSGRVDMLKDDTVVQSWAFQVKPDEPPMIRLDNDPEEQLSGALKFSYLVKDDYGVVAAEAGISPVPGTSAGTKTPRPLVEAPQFPLSLPAWTGTAKTGETIRDLTSHPWAGSEVNLILTARDEAGQVGTSAPHRFKLPQRLFRKPLARSVVEQRRDLALDANNIERVLIAFDALMLAPDVFNMETRTYLGMDFAYRQLVKARTDEDLKDLLPLLWDLALTIEDGDLSVAERNLRNAQEALRKALEEGASEEEIAKLTQQLREALNEYMQALAEQMRRNPQVMQPFNSNQQTLSQQDLNEMLNRIEELARTGSRDAARELLAQMQQMLENLQAGRPQMMQDQMTSEMMQMLNELGKMIQRQQQLMDQTNEFNRDQQRQGKQSQQGQQGQQDGPGQRMTEEQLGKLLEQLQQSQGDLAEQLQQLMDQLAQNGMGENKELGEAGESMGEAEQSLGEGQGEQAVGEQGNALDALRRGAQGLTEQMMNQGQGPGMAEGRGPSDEDPLGRPRRTDGADFGNRVKVPDEIDVQRARRILEELRRRFSDPSRPKLELDYLERLLKRY